MIWKNKTHEYDIFANTLLCKNHHFSKIYIWGAGILGNELANVLIAYNCFAGYIDNDLDKQTNGYLNHKVYSPQYILDCFDGLIVICATNRNIQIIENQLNLYNFKKDKDYYTYDRFCNFIFPIVSTYYYEKSFVSLAQISLTERCTLKCKKCAHGCYAVNNKSNDLLIQQVFQSADSFFSKVDYCKEFVLIGGEPLLYKDLPEAIQYIGKKYRKKIGIFSITTNGTILPNDEVIASSKENDILFRISNYSQQLPHLKSSYQNIKNKLKQNGISYILGDKELEWMDYGFEYVNRKATEEDLIKVFDECKTPCREIRESKFYYCVMARSISDNLRYHVGQNDYLELDKLIQKDYKKELLEFTLGFSKKGYLDMCQYCHGSEAKKYPIPVAEQVKNIDL